MMVAASRLFGAAAETQVKNAWAAVGVGDPATFKISGYVRSGGAGMAGVRSSLSGASTAVATTAANGFYQFSSLVANGDYAITPTDSDTGFSPPSRSFVILGSDQTADFVATYAISGRAVKKGRGIAGGHRHTDRGQQFDAGHGRGWELLVYWACFRPELHRDAVALQPHFFAAKLYCGCSVRQLDAQLRGDGGGYRAFEFDATDDRVP